MIFKLNTFLINCYPYDKISKYNCTLTNAKVWISEPNGNPEGNDIGSEAASELPRFVINFLLSLNSRNPRTPISKEKYEQKWIKYVGFV